MPCNPSDLTLTEPSGPAGPSIPGFGSPFAPGLPNIKLPFPDGFPEDLLEIMDLLQLILPSGILKPPLNPNFGKDIFDGIMKLLDQFMPFLMMYKFFLPILDLIICIIEVLCAIPNPFKLIKALKRLFRTCLPAFLSLFPIFALIMMLISLLLLILALIEYIIAQILKLILLILKNIRTIVRAFTRADGPSILAALKKIGMVLCAFQNLFVLLAIFKTIIDLIKSILSLFFRIPPCADGDNSDPDNCCTTDVCPDFIKNNEELVRTTGTLQYFNEVAVASGLTLPALFGDLNATIRSESWQFYDSGAFLQQAFINITSAYDLPPGITQIFFPTEGTYNAATPPSQAPYTVDLRLFYNPVSWGRVDSLGARYIRVKDCIVTAAPTTSLSAYNNSTTVISNGVLKLAGGSVVEDDGLTQIFIDSSNATLENFIHSDATVGSNPSMLETDGYKFSSVEYTFKINHEVLLQKSLITLGCIPTVALDRTFVNTVFGANANLNFSLLNALVNGTGFPDLGAAQECLTTALTALRNNISEAGVAEFQAMTTVCLEKLRTDTTSAINDLIGIGFDNTKSTFSIDPNVQFTTNPIKVKVSLKEGSGQPLASKIPASVAEGIALRIVPTITFGTISKFTYDGEEFFEADLTATEAGEGTIKMSFDSKTFMTVNIPDDITVTPTLTEQVLDYTFIYSPFADMDGKPRRDASDSVRDSTEGGG